VGAEPGPPVLESSGAFCTCALRGCQKGSCHGSEWDDTVGELTPEHRVGGGAGGLATGAPHLSPICGGAFTLSAEARRGDLESPTGPDSFSY
jgi:hypothetical protein